LTTFATVNVQFQNVEVRSLEQSYSGK